MRAIIHAEVDRLVAMSGGCLDNGVYLYAKNRLWNLSADDSEYQEAIGDYLHKTSPKRRLKTPQFMGKG